MFNRQNEHRMKNIQGRTFVKGGWMEVSVLATSLGKVHRKQYQKCNSCQRPTLTDATTELPQTHNA